MLQKDETVVVVTDEPMERQALAITLRRRLGCRVLEAGGAAEAQQLVEGQQTIRLLVTNGAMPGGATGLELARWFRGKYPQAKVLIAFGSLAELQYQANDLNQIAFLAKPFTPSELVRMVHQLLD